MMGRRECIVIEMTMVSLNETSDISVYGFR